MAEAHELVKTDDMVTRFVELFRLSRVRRAIQASGIIMTAYKMYGSEFTSRQNPVLC
jgi:hypothetical protein